ncbi:hypothetical protein EVAR_70229_1 [Eumeta japonica]|uniref:Uncharacterized protein n=1 Tax=Eumeta variegata TaxID=151549 RepID=A0A4C1T1R3_EUMVA|nr:hypothetical protein EVAR_70229_1 [Eumeta japonica]
MYRYILRYDLRLPKRMRKPPPGKALRCISAEEHARARNDDWGQAILERLEQVKCYPPKLLRLRVRTGVRPSKPAEQLRHGRVSMCTIKLPTRSHERLGQVAACSKVLQRQNAPPHQILSRQ